MKPESASPQSPTTRPAKVARANLRDLTREFDMKNLLPTLSAGLVLGILTVVVEISFATMIFSGPFAPYLSRGIGFMLFGAVVISAIIALTSSFPNAAALPQDGPAAIMAAIAAIIATQVAADQALYHNGKQPVQTLVAVLMTASFFTGVGLFLLGRLKLGNLVRYIPFPVVGGFLGGTGYFLLQGGFGAMADENFSTERLSYLMQPEMLIRWLPGVIFGVTLLLILRRRNHFMIIPAMLIGGAVLFYLVMFVTRTSIDQAHTLNLLLGPFPQNQFWQPPDFFNLPLVDWRVVLGQMGNIFTILLISIFSLLLNMSGLEVATKRDIDLNHELQISGIATFIAGVFGSTPGYSSVSFSALGTKFGSNSRLIGIIVAVMCFIMLFFGTWLLNLVPKFILGGLLIFLGLSFLSEWLWDTWSRLSKRDYMVIVVITVVMIIFGVLEGVVVGMLFAVATFVADYSRVSVVKHTFSGEYFHSNVERSSLEADILTQKGYWIYVLELQGFLFFGTANHLFEQVRQQLNNAESGSTPRYIVLNFKRVAGVDISAVMSLQKMKQIAAGKNCVLVFTSLHPTVQKRLEKEIFTPQDANVWKVFPDLDHGLEWCETQVLRTFEEIGFSFKRKAASIRLDSLLPTTDEKSFLENLIGDALSANKPKSVLDQLFGYFTRQEVEKDYILLQQGQPSQGLYFIEKGQVSILQERDGQTLRLRTLREGTIIGEVSMYTNEIVTASAVATIPSTLYFISLEDLRAMETNAPDAALALHKFLGSLLSERLTHANKALEAALE